MRFGHGWLHGRTRGADAAGGLSFVPGMDAAGVIDQLGPGVEGRLAVGQRVMALVLFTGPHGGVYAEQVVLPAASVASASVRSCPRAWPGPAEWGIRVRTSRSLMRRAPSPAGRGTGSGTGRRCLKGAAEGRDQFRSGPPEKGAWHARRSQGSRSRAR
ncbi:alcohol dehydrogenase catalytic domain-containing protein [Streptomyces rubiginosohelvolus]|uniref:alcohol dehydrogenase catalytic domain-containing protein n=1 Tax=Streptomyces rubiginosohelvolus TaxID=67362 RepID=UPI0036D9824D